MNVIGTCKVKTDMHRCRDCVDQQLIYGVFRSCDECIENLTCHVLSVDIDIFGRTYAMILRGGILEKVPFDRIYDVTIASS